MGGQRVIAMKVAALIAISLALLGLFIVSMGDISFAPTYSVLVGFDDPANLQTGAPVQIAGVKVGTVREIEYVGGQPDPHTGEPMPMVRIRVRIEKRYQPHIHEDAEFYLTARGLLADMIMVIDPGSPDLPALAPGAHIVGKDLPRLDRVLAEGSNFLTDATSALREHRPAIRTALLRAAKALRRTGSYMDRNEHRLDAVGSEVEQLSLDGVEMVRQARREYVDNPEVDRTIARIDRVAATAGGEMPETLAEWRTSAADARASLHSLMEDDGPAQISQALSDVGATVADSKEAVAELRAAVEPIRRGRTALGGVVMDERLYDDLEETVQHLRKNPWKFFWKE